MRLALLIALIALATGGGPLAAQGVHVDGPRTAVRVGVFAGAGSGPIDAAAWGVEAGVPVWRYLAVRAEYSAWGPGFRGMSCIAMPPESHRCSVSGRVWLAGLSANVPVHESVEIFAEASGGRFTRDWLHDETVSSRAASAEAGVRVRLFRGLTARVGGRVLQMDDPHYESLLGENLRYTMKIMGLEYGVSR